MGMPIWASPDIAHLPLLAGIGTHMSPIWARPYGTHMGPYPSWVSGISDYGTGSLVSQWGNTIKVIMSAHKTVPILI